MKKSTLASLAAIPAVVLATANSAMAAVPATVTTALDTIGADALTVAGVVLVAIVSIFAFKFLRKGL